MYKCVQIFILAGLHYKVTHFVILGRPYIHTVLNLQSACIEHLSDLRSEKLAKAFCHVTSP
jgi:hypothetical protein